MAKIKFRALGFSLIELSIVMTVLSVIATSTLPYIQASVKADKTKVTTQRLDEIETAMVAFRLANKRLPCPAPLSFSLVSSSYGTEATSTASDTVAPITCSAGATPALTGTSSSVFGAVPVKALGLPDETGFDSWGKAFAYHVDRRMTITNATDTYGANSIVPGEFTVYDGATTPTARTAKAVYQ
jgi:prepilin-type N-terminal cleavage/methylation domain-containing protein